MGRITDFTNRVNVEPIYYAISGWCVLEFTTKIWSYCVKGGPTPDLYVGVYLSAPLLLLCIMVLALHICELEKQLYAERDRVDAMAATLVIHDKLLVGDGTRVEESCQSKKTN